MTIDQIRDYECLKEAIEKANNERDSILKVINGVDGTGKVFSVAKYNDMKDRINKTHIGLTIEINNLLKQYKLNLDELIKSI